MRFAKLSRICRKRRFSVKARTGAAMSESNLSCSSPVIKRAAGRSGWGVALLFLCAPFSAAQTQDDFFDDTYIHELRLTVKSQDWDTLRQHFLDNTYYPADFHWIFKGKDILVQN